MDPSIQQDIDARAKGPRVTPDDLEAEIVGEFYFTAGEGMAGAASAMSSNSEASILVDQDLSRLDLLTFCVLRLRNGYTVTGESACVSAENFDASIGRAIARTNAIEKLWPLLGFRLADRLYIASEFGTYPVDR